jgi:hypothetical protein
MASASLELILDAIQCFAENIGLVRKIDRGWEEEHHVQEGKPPGSYF